MNRKGGVMFKRSDPLTAFRLVAVFLFACLTLAACCPPYCSSGTGVPGPGNTEEPPSGSNPQGSNPPGPHNYPPEWQAALMDGKAAEVLLATDQIIIAGKSAPGYADAYLYRGLAKFFQGDLQGAQGDLMMADTLKDGFFIDSAQQEQVLLYRALMIVSAQLGQKDSAAAYLDRAVQLAPDQADAIRRELDARALMLTGLTPH
jgi:hypothetical protein